jgi:hypothetical protein
MQQDNETAARNSRYAHFMDFRKSIELFPARTFDMFHKHASEDFKNSAYIRKCLELYSYSLINSVV